MRLIRSNKIRIARERNTLCSHVHDISRAGRGWRIHGCALAICQHGTISRGRFSWLIAGMQRDRCRIEPMLMRRHLGNGEGLCFAPPSLPRLTRSESGSGTRVECRSAPQVRQCKSGPPVAPIRRAEKRKKSRIAADCQ